MNIFYCFFFCKGKFLLKSISDSNVYLLSNTVKKHTKVYFTRLDTGSHSAYRIKEAHSCWNIQVWFLKQDN